MLKLCLSMFIMWRSFMIEKNKRLPILVYI